jgi:hypothetical protein
MILLSAASGEDAPDFTDVQAMPSAFSQTPVLPDVWRAILSGGIQPGEVPKFRAEYYGGRKRGNGDMLKRYDDRLASLDRNVVAANLKSVEADLHLQACKNARAEALTILNASKAVETVMAMDRHIGVVFAAGTAWTVLLAIANIPSGLDPDERVREDERSNFLRGKLAAYVSYRSFCPDCARACLGSSPLMRQKTLGPLGKPSTRASTL